MSGCWVPTSWVRKPPLLSQLGTFKAEDLKNFGLFYGAILFNGERVDRRITHLWELTSDFLHNVSDVAPRKEDTDKLQHVLAKTHGLFTYMFLAPLPHSQLHLPEILRQCGPLPNVAQFLTERVVGEAELRVKSRRGPIQNLFHTYHLMFASVF